jgi:hypothetical protein
MTQEEKEQVNKNRHAIGLPSVEEEFIIIQCNMDTVGTFSKKMYLCIHK